MHVSALLDFDVVPVDSADAVTALLGVTAPEKPTAKRPPATLQIVLDRSGSMGRGRLAGAVRALLELVDRLDPTDDFGLVSFDHQARVEVPAGPLTDKAEVKRRIRALQPGGATDLSSGLLRGIQEARRASGDRGATLLLISDGHANRGITDHRRLAECARSAHGHGVATGTLGYGLGYDEELLGAVSDGGTGSALFAEEPDTAGELIAGEVDHLLDKTAQAASLRAAPVGAARSVSVVGELPSARLDDGSVMVELGDLHSGEQRRLLLRVDVPGTAALGAAQVASVEVTYVDPASLTTYTVSLPVSVNVVPGDDAAGRIPDPTVRTELAYQEAQTAKREAAASLQSGDREAAAAKLESARRRLAEGRPSAPAGMRDDVDAQLDELGELARRARRDDAKRVSKAAYSSQYQASRKRGRAQQGPEVRPPQAPGGDDPGRRR
ncbi:Ca-activated chloride channel family protein [Spinactinospora alkalitolerans]|uniref:Ca-activated chloride channel family protein n=1 Tax=Spinactinospora alkalitolerans TaxID=687207 RepID=A0A852TT59_9ACTN|nr:VWA domain-containing protein [Spinactinospora alkalitolerans]NYE46042.1 Ca-activated chloride channel family protein [Spinactinospora alkalitolerans]